MKKRVLLTTTSFQDTPGSHQELLNSKDWEVVNERGPLTEERMLELAGEFDGFLCGDDAITPAVIDKSLPRLKVISKYGIGLDKIDLDYATEKKIPVLFTPGVNHTTVAEHTIGLMIAMAKHIVPISNAVSKGEWLRLTGNELYQKTLGVIGMGRIGKEVIIRAKAFGMDVVGFTFNWDEEFAKEHGVRRAESPQELFKEADVISLHCRLSDDTRHFINSESIASMKDGAYIINCARGEVIDTAAVVEALESGKLAGYGADVLDQEPPAADHPLLGAKNALITSHIGSRTYESVQRQANRALLNLANYFEEGDDIICANGLV